MLAGSAWADSVTFDFVNEDYGMTRLSGTTSEYNPSGTVVTNGAVELVTDGNTRLWSDGMRFYKGSSVNITAAGGVITGIELLSSKDAAITTNFDFSPQTADGTYTNWNGNAQELKMSCTVSKGNAAVGKMVVYYEPTGAPVLKPADISFPEAVYSVEEGTDFESPVLANPNDLNITYISTNEAVATVDAEGKVTLTGVGTTTIVAESDATDEFRAGKASYTLTVLAAPVRVNNLAEWYEKCQTNGDRAVMNFESIVTYVNGAYVYFIDEDVTAGGLIYGNTGNYAAGDFLPSGWSAVTSIYNGLPEMKIEGEGPAAEPGDVLAYDDIFSVTEGYLNRVVRLMAVTFEEATPDSKTTFTGVTSDGNTVTFYNQFLAESVEAGDYNVVVAVAKYKDNLQCYVISYEEIGGGGDDPIVNEPKVVFGGSSEIVETEYGMAYEAFVDNASDTVDINFENLAEGTQVYYVDLTDLFFSEYAPAKRMSVSDFKDFVASMDLELLEAVDNKIPVSVGAHFYQWWYAVDGNIANPSDRGDGQGCFVVRGPAVDLSVIKMVVGDNVEPVSNEEYDIYYDCKVASADEVVTIKFENVPEGVDVYFVAYGGGGGDWEPYKRMPADMVAEMIGMELLEDNTISFGVGEYVCGYLFAVNGEISEEQIDDMVTFDLSVSVASSVASLEAAGAADGYYDLSGKAVENAKGLCIRMQNGKAQVIIRK